ncbi:PREDICTED: plasminogen receptor (KT)-like isoform X1 [Priapulus caudatus]|uniref:Plasminogen receptor (KT)-like isoform X1 n=1 Tax=Priapulus caudatus TaxID=37621 RepID=A0ABM1EIQ2_PRICU|nr:PREDICTED: plasminogen receptor (KT)-like isoform X1 [Priapulus caudatus]
MGSIVGKAMDDNIKKQQEFMLATQRLAMERQIQMQNQMRERMMAMQIAKSREFFWWWAAFYSLAAPAMMIGAKRQGNHAIAVPLVPLTFVVGYLADMAYGNKLERIRHEAEIILQDTPDMLTLPSGTPTYNTIERARLAQKDAQELESKNELFL